MELFQQKLKNRIKALLIIFIDLVIGSDKVTAPLPA